MSQRSDMTPVAMMSSRTRAGPHGMAPAMIAAIMVGVQALFVFCLGYPLLHASPHAVPVGLAGPPAAIRELRTEVNRQPGAVSVRIYPDAAAARAAVRARAVSGALIAGPRHTNLLAASAGAPQIAAMLATLARGQGTSRMAVTDLVPAPRRDPQEVGALATLLPLILLSIALGAALALAERQGWRRLGWCVSGSMATGLAVSAIAGGLGTFAGSYWADATVFAVLVFGLSAASAGLVGTRRLRPLEGLFALTMLCLGIPSIGALVPSALLAQPWRALGPYLPPGAALSALRGITFFGGAAIAQPLAVLACWGAAGLLLSVLAAVAGARAQGRGGQDAPSAEPVTGRRGAQRQHGDRERAGVDGPVKFGDGK